MAALGQLKRLVTRPIQLNFDVNKTLIMIDPSGGKTLRDVLNSNVSSLAVGKLLAPTQGSSDPPGWQPVKLVMDDDEWETSEVKALVPYDDFVDHHLFPKPAEMASMSEMEARALWKEVTRKRRLKKNVFTEPNEPGALYRPLFEEMEKKMIRPDTGKPYFIIPAFYRLINELNEAKLPFQLNFRTFGDDFDEVDEDLADWINGRHCVTKVGGAESFPSKGMKIERLSVFRNKAGAVHVCRGQASLPSMEEFTDEKAFESFLSAAEKASHVIKRNLSLVELEREVASGMNKLQGIRDQYDWWAIHGESKVGGKVFPVDTSTSAEFHQLFFDDNINLGMDRSIVDARCIHCGCTLDSEAERRYLVPVEAAAAILNETYFVDRMVACIALQAAEVPVDSGRLPNAEGKL